MCCLVLEKYYKFKLETFPNKVRVERIKSINKTEIPELQFVGVQRLITFNF